MEFAGYPPARAYHSEGLEVVPVPGQVQLAWSMRRALFTIGAVLVAGAGAFAQSGFVSVSGRQFMVDGRPFHVAGTNSYNQAIQRHRGQTGVEEVFAEMAARSMTVMRTWAFQDAVEAGDCILCAPARQLTGGEQPIDFISEDMLRALDATLANAAETNVRVILALVNNWGDYGGMDRWTLWRFGTVNHDLFYSDETIRAWFKAYVQLLVNRVNTVNGRVYRDDPTLFAWELTNEARSSSSAASQLNAWMGEMSAYVKSIDPNHLVTTGIEGFYAGAYAGRNTDTWMSDSGQNFIANHLHATMDFATIHIWPENWGWDPIGNTSYAQNRATLYVQRHIDDASNILGKPLLIEEFGIPRDNHGTGINSGPTTKRDAFFTLYADLCEGSALAGGSCAGMTVWILFDDGSAGWDDGNGVFFPTDAATDTLLSANAAVMARMRRADLDFDLDVDQSDFGIFQVCLSGSGHLVASPECNNADLDADGDVDDVDTALFRRCLTGAGEESDPNCVY